MQIISRSSIAKTGNIGNYTLIQDSMPLTLLEPPKMLKEDVNGGTQKVLRLTGQFQYANKPNHNGRIYELGILEHAVKEIQEDITHRRVMGELDHPQDAKIHLDRVSHLVSKLWMEGDQVLGELEIVKGTPCGDILGALVNSGVTVGISSRGVGDMESTMLEGDEVMKVLPGYTFVTYDVVAEPSVHDSYLSVMESRRKLLGTATGSKHYDKLIVKEARKVLADFLQD